MKNKITSTIKKYNMFSHEDYIAVAFSGGADSTALLDILYKQGIKVCAIHVNHMIRGEEADRDEGFCRDFCKARDIPFFCHRVDVPREAEKSGESLELAARRLRYAAIEETVSAERIDRVATAHHADDNAETVIFNIVRGSGAKGGCGIPPVRGIYVRPLIECTRAEITEYCSRTELAFVTDSTNLQTDYTRNFIRHEILPQLKEINPKATDAFTSFSNALRKDNELLESLVPEKATRGELAALPDPLLTRYIQRRCDTTAKPLEALMSAIRRGNEYILTDMGNSVVAVCDRNSLIFRHKITQPTHCGGTIDEGVSEKNGFGSFFVTRNLCESDRLKNIYNLSIYTYLKFDKIKGSLFVRSRRDGDSYRYNGMTHSLKKLFNGRKIPVEKRKSIPLVCDESGILWIPGFLPRDDVKADKKEENIIFIGYIGESNDT